MIGVSNGAVWAATLVLLATAGVGSYLGYSRVAEAPGGSAGDDTFVAPLEARKASPVTDGPAAPPPVDETYIRKLAHDEAMAVLHPPKKVPAVVSSDDSDDSSDDDAKSPGANPPTPPPTAAQPAPVVVPKPPPPPTGLY